MSPLLTLYWEYLDRQRYDRERHQPPGNVVATQVAKLPTLYREYLERAIYEREKAACHENKVRTGPTSTT